MYSFAFRIAELPVLLVTHVIVSVALPVWSGLAAEPDRLRSWFLRTCLWAGVVNAAVAGAGLAVAPHVLPLPQGMTWEASRPLVLVLMLASFGRSLIILAEPYFYSTGKPAVWFWMNACRVSTTAILIVPLTRMFGIVGVALAVVAGVFSTIPVAIHEMNYRHPPERVRRSIWSETCLSPRPMSVCVFLCSSVACVLLWQLLFCGLALSVGRLWQETRARATVACALERAAQFGNQSCTK